MIYPADLRIRIITVVCALFIFTPVRQLLPAAVGTLAVLTLYLIKQQNLPWRRLFHLEGFLILLLITLPFTIDGTEIFSIGPLVASQEGLLRAIILIFKVTASVLLLSFYFASEDPMDIGRALRGLYLPESLVRLFVAVVRYIHLIHAEFNRLHESMRARGFKPKSSWHTWRSYGYLLGMLLVRAIDRAERIEQAMRLRGYNGKFPSAVYVKPKFADFFSAVIIIAGTALILLWDVLWPSL